MEAALELAAGAGDKCDAACGRTDCADKRAKVAKWLRDFKPEAIRALAHPKGPAK